MNNWVPSINATKLEVEQHFVELINILMNEYILIINNVSHQLLEVELYYTSQQHPDPYTHLNPDQTTSGYFHFHKAGNQPQSKYKGGSYKGLDISVGYNDNINKTYGGILIRSIQNLESKEIIVGPCKSVDYILQQCKVNSIEELTQLSVFPLSIDRKVNNLLNILPLRCTRIGLYLTKNVDVQIQGYYMKKKYRFVSWTYLHVIAKETKSKISITIGLLYLNKTLKYIQNILKSNPEKIIEQFNIGCTLTDLKPYTGHSLSSINEIAQCLGCLHRSIE
jgi:hypothetical protein